MIHIVLYQPEKPENTGNIMRTCVAFNCVLHLIEPLGFYVDDKHLKRAGMDYIDGLVWYKHESYEDFMKDFPGEYYFISRYGQKSPDEFEFDKDKDVFFIFGKESTGLPLSIMKDHLDRQIRIPMEKKARSLNLSNSVAIIAYEALRQFEFNDLSKTEYLKGPDYRGNDF